MCNHPKLIEYNNTTLYQYELNDKSGGTAGGFHWKRYICENCGRLITILSAVEEDVMEINYVTKYYA